MPKRRTITPEDLYDFQQITDLEISPDGMHIVYSLQRVDKKTEKKYTNLWIVPTGKGKPRQFTFGDHSDSHPRWSPDGSQIAFLSNRHNEKDTQIYVIPFGGGEACKVTDLKGYIGTFEWSPDGTRLLVAYTAKSKAELRLEEDEQAKKLGPTFRKVTRPFYKMDGMGFLPEDQQHLWVVDVKSGKSTQITGHDDEIHSEEDAHWSPDGKTIVFCSNRTDDPDLHPDLVDLYLIPAQGGEMRKLETPAGGKGMPSFSPDGKYLAWFGQPRPSDWWQNQRLWVMPLDGSAPAQDLTGQFDFETGADVINDLEGAMKTSPPTWSADGKRIYFQVSRHGRCTLHSIARDGNDLQTIIDEPGVVGKFTINKKETRIVYFFGTLTDPGQIRVRRINSNVKRLNRTLTKLNRRSLNRIALGETEEVWFEGPAGNNLQGWILKPPGFDPTQKYPAILEIHGGPLTQYGEFFMHEFYYLAAQGYVVFYCNPRGGQGYGEEHAKAIWGGWGTVDYDDIMAWTDYVAALPYIDADRMGVTGGSYGGYMTLWVIGHTQRFKAAVAQRVVSNLISMWGSSDFNWVFQQPINNKPPWEDLQAYWRHSPIAYLGNARTPTKIIHSEQDHRCPIEQGEQAFIALRTQGVPVEFIRFPGEPHGLSRVGRTDKRIARLKHIAEWMDKYLKGESA